MKKILFLSGLALAAAFTVSCNKENIEGENGNLPGGESVLFPAQSVINASSAATRTTLDDTSILWKAGDAITLFSEDGTPVPYVLDGNGGENTGTFRIDGDTPAQVTAYAVYPATKNMMTENTVSVTVPAEQTYVANGFPTDYPMAAVTSNGTDFTFENLATVLNLTLQGDAVVRTISIRPAAEDENLAGNALIDFNGTTPVLNAAENASKTVTLDCGEAGINISEETSFNFIVFPGEYTNGFSITVTETNGNTTTKTTGGTSMTLNAGAIAKLNGELPVVTPQGWNLVGDFNDWGASWVDLIGGHGIYYCSNVTIPDAENNAFKIRKGATRWFGQTGTVEVMKPVKANENGNGDFTIAAGTYDFYFVEDNTNIIVTEHGVAAFSVIGNINGTLYNTDFPMVIKNGWLVAQGIEFTGDTFKIRTTGKWNQDNSYNIGVGTEGETLTVGTPHNVWSHTSTHDMTITGTEAGQKYDIYLDMKRHDPNNSADNMTVWVMPEGQVPSQSAE